MPASNQRKNGADLHPGVAVQMPEAKLPSYATQIPKQYGSKPASGAANGSRLPHFLVVLLALVLSYVLFTVGTMVPQARAHFLHLMINPAPAHFLAD